ncbi:curli production assembly/transport protein CsgE [Oceanisphaera profunda]|nr:curli production assembly/transport protein CsgE [Oceanisphaera profunda]
MERQACSKSEAFSVQDRGACLGIAVGYRGKKKGVMRKGSRTVLMGVMLMLLSSGVSANEDEMMGFIVDNSISRVGHEFYRYFTERLRDTSQMDFNLVVRERPSARWGSLVWVEYEGRTLYRNFLAPNTSQLQSVAHEAADLIRDEVARQKLENMFQDTFDLERDEL